MDRIDLLQIFLRVAATGSFSQAADQLSLPRPTVSLAVQQLEARLGTRLLHRTTRRLSLTESGAAYFERARQILDALHEADAEASSAALQAAGRLRINAPLTFGNLHLAPLWGEFLKLHPGVELDITLTDRVVDLVEEGYDLAVRIAPHGQLAGASLVARRLATDRMVLCASPAYLRGAPALSHPRDLSAHPVMAYAWWSGGEAWRFTGPAGETETVAVRARLRTNSGDTCRAAALADQGVIWQPAFLVGADLHAGRLVELLPHWQGPELTIHAVWPSRHHLPGKVRAMVDFLAAAFAQPGWR